LAGLWRSGLTFAGRAILAAWWGESRRGDWRVALSAARRNVGEGLGLAVSKAIYRVDAAVRRAAALQSHPLEAGPRIVLNPADAAAASLAEGAMAKVDNGLGTATLQVVIDARVATGAAWVESGYGATAALGAGRVRVTGVN